MKKFLIKKATVFTTILVIILSLLLTSCGTSSSSSSDKKTSVKKPIVIECPMQVESTILISKLKNKSTEKTGNITFYKGTINSYPVIVAQINMGMENAAAATEAAILKYSPLAIINQGTSGGHTADLNVMDIVLGAKTVNINSYKSPDKEKGQGMDASTWVYMDVDAPPDKSSTDIHYYNGDTGLLKAANEVKSSYTKGKVVEGIIGSGDFWDNEYDRIAWLHEKFKTNAEEMEGAAVAQIAGNYKVPFLCIRVLSNSKVANQEYNVESASACQEYVYKVVQKYISENTLK